MLAFPICRFMAEFYVGGTGREEIVPPSSADDSELVV